MFEHLMNDVEYDGKNYYVSTNDTPDAGLETMIFAVDENGQIDWHDLYVEHYATEEAATEKHKYICENIHEFIEED